ncbi:MAG: PqiC family protein, partial [Candidatus Binataceae bacterium]
MRGRLSVIVAAVALGALAAGGCFSPRPDPSKFFVLTPIGSAAANSIAPTGLTASSSLTIGIGPIKLPGYLDRDEVVTRVSPNRLELSNMDRWAEPLDNNFKQVIAQDLTQSLGTHSITFYPWP